MLGYLRLSALHYRTPLPFILLAHPLTPHTQPARPLSEDDAAYLALTLQTSPDAAPCSIAQCTLAATCADIFLARCAALDDGLVEPMPPAPAVNRSGALSP